MGLTSIIERSASLGDSSVYLDRDGVLNFNGFAIHRRLIEQ